ncbi:hypothetical protein CDAR_83921 [Caerostris darwini]|uniref:C2H2-type domain-containing protein n=1 Tax=Caerostris darwini TaxID=1538125 RepID=A0AAV4X1P3_9ARAC|nr:hypothetical protein CDAR_83921 [Caerostris darwini]
MFVVNATKIENGTTRLTVVPHICGICKKAFLQEKALLEHFKTHADGDNATVTLSSTEIEKEVLKTKSHRNKHLKTHGLVNVNDVNTEKSMLSDIGCNEESEKSEIKVEDDEWMDEESEIISEEDE